MSDILPTIRIKFGDDFAIINESDFDAELHELFDEPEVQDDPEADPDDAKPTSIEKGPRGMFYVMQDGKRVSRGFKTEDEAIAEMGV